MDVKQAIQQRADGLVFAGLGNGNSSASNGVASIGIRPATGAPDFSSVAAAEETPVSSFNLNAANKVAATYQAGTIQSTNAKPENFNAEAITEDIHDAIAYQDSRNPGSKAWTSFRALLGDEDARRELQYTKVANQQELIAGVERKYGVKIQPEGDHYVFYGPDGVKYSTEQGFWGELGDMTEANLGSLLGSVAGAAMAASVVATSTGVGAPAGAGLAAAGTLAGLLGGAIGAGAGSWIDEASAHVRLGGDDSIVRYNDLAQIAQNTSENALLDMAAGGLFMAAGKGAKATAKATGLDKVASNVGTAVADKVLYNVGTKEGIKKNLVATGVGAAAGLIDPTLGTVAGLGTRMLLGGGSVLKKKAGDLVETATQAAGKEANGVFGKAKGTLEDTLAKMTSGIAETDMHYFRTQFAEAYQNPEKLAALNDYFEKAGIKLSGDKNSQEVLKVLLSEPGSAPYFNAITNLDNGIPSKNLRTYIAAKSLHFNNTIKKMASEGDVNSLINHLVEGKNSVKAFTDAVGDITKGLKSQTLYIKAGEASGIVGDYRAIYKQLLDSSPESLGVSSKLSAGTRLFNARSSSNPIINNAALSTAERTVLAQQKMPEIKLTLKDLLEVEYDYMSINKSVLTKDAIARVDRAINTLRGTIDKLIADNIEAGTIDASAASLIKEARAISYDHMSKYAALANNAIYTKLMAGQSKDAFANNLLQEAMVMENASGLTQLMQFMSVLDAKNMKTVEGIIVNKAVEKSLKEVEGRSLVDWVNLASTLNNLKLITAEAKGIRDLVNEYANVFANDIAIANALRRGSISTGTGAGVGMTANLLSKVRIRAANTLWSKLLTIFSRDTSFKEMRIAQMAAKALANPMDANIQNAFEKTMADTIKKYENDFIVKDALTEFKGTADKLLTDLRATTKVLEEAREQLDTMPPAEAEAKATELAQQVPDNSIQMAVSPAIASEAETNKVVDELVKTLAIIKTNNASQLIDATFLAVRDAANKNIELNGYDIFKRVVKKHNAEFGKDATRKISPMTKDEYMDSISKNIMDGKYDDLEALAKELQSTVMANTTPITETKVPSKTKGKKKTTKAEKRETKKAEKASKKQSSNNKLIEEAGGTVEQPKSILEPAAEPAPVEQPKSIVEPVTEPAPVEQPSSIVMPTREAINNMSDTERAASQKDLFKAAMGKVSGTTTKQPEETTSLVEKGVTSETKTKAKAKKETKSKEVKETKLVEKGLTKEEPKEAPKEEPKAKEEPKKKETKKKETKKAAGEDYETKTIGGVEVSVTKSIDESTFKGDAKTKAKYQALAKAENDGNLEEIVKNATIGRQDRISMEDYSAISDKLAKDAEAELYDEGITDKTKIMIESKSRGKNRAAPLIYKDLSDIRGIWDFDKIKTATWPKELDLPKGMKDTKPGKLLQETYEEMHGTGVSHIIYYMLAKRCPHETPAALEEAAKKISAKYYRTYNELTESQARVMGRLD